MNKEQEKEWKRLDQCMKVAMYGTIVIALSWLCFKIFVYFRLGQVSLDEFPWLFLGVVIWFILKNKRDSLGIAKD